MSGSEEMHPCMCGNSPYMLDDPFIDANVIICDKGHLIQRHYPKSLFNEQQAIQTWNAEMSMYLY